MCNVFIYVQIYITLWVINFLFIFDTCNNFKGGPPSSILNLNVLNVRHRQYDCFKRPSLTVSYTYMSMCGVNNFKGVNQYIHNNILSNKQNNCLDIWTQTMFLRPSSFYCPTIGKSDLQNLKLAISDNNLFSFLISFFIHIFAAFNRCAYISLCHGVISRLLFVFLTICDICFSWTFKMSFLALILPTLITIFVLPNILNQESACL